MSGGYRGDEPRRGGISGGYGQEPRYRGADPRESDQPDGDGAPTGGGSGDLSDLWREPDPWAADARRGLGEWQEPGSRPENGTVYPPGREDPYRRAADPYPRDEDAEQTRAYSGDRERRDDQRPDRPSYRGTGGTGRGGPRSGAGSRRTDPGPAPSYQSPVVWDGPDRAPSRERGEPDAPAGTHRTPDGWYAPDDQPRDQPRDQAPRRRPGSQPRPGGQDAWRQAPPPAGPPRRPTGPATPASPVRPAGPASPPSSAAAPEGGERAWWDDAFRPSAPSAPGQPGPESPLPPVPPPGPSGRPSRPAPPRRPSAQGYGVPPGELTQPISIFQPQAAFVADAYPVAGPSGGESVAETVLDLRPVTGEHPAAAGTSLARSTGSMAIGTLISRVTGFLRTFVFIFALGTLTLANAYNNANTLPNAVYDVMIGGVLTSVVVPLLVKAAQEHRDGGEAYNQRMFTLTVLALGVVTIVATVAAGLLVDLYAGSVHGTEHRLMVVFAYFFIPQIFFYGLSSLIGAILNTRNSFAAPMWTPIINNVIVIVVGLLFVVTIGLHKTASTVSAGGVLLLGIGTTLGIIVQTVALIPALRKVGFRWHPRFDFRRAELGEIGRMAIWMLGYVVSTQITFIVTTRLANAASVQVPDAGVSAYNYSYALFLLPYAIIGVSVTTALLPRMSRNAAEGKFWLVRDDFSASIRLSSVILVPAALLLAVLGPPLCEFLFGHGSTSVPDARYIGEAFAAFSLGLVPFVIFQLLLRVFYALHDSRTPAMIGFLTMIVTVIGNVIVAAILPAGQVVVGMAFVYGASYVFSAMIAWRQLNKRVGSLDGRVITRSLVRMHVAAVPPLIFAFVVSAAVGAVIHPGSVYGFITVLVGGGGALLLYIIVARMLRLDELSQLMRMVGGRFGGRARSSARP
jgi:murein biosynthesis integral membrane protein MurJ